MLTVQTEPVSIRPGATIIAVEIVVAVVRVREYAPEPCWPPVQGRALQDLTRDTSEWRGPPVVVPILSSVPAVVSLPLPEAVLSSSLPLHSSLLFPFISGDVYA